MKNAIFFLLFFLGCTWPSCACHLADTVKADTLNNRGYMAEPADTSIFVRSNARLKNSFNERVVTTLRNRTRIALDGGWAYNIGTIYEVNPPALSSYLDKLQSGYNFRVSAQRFWGGALGVGVTYALFHASHTAPNASLVDPERGYVKDYLKDNIYMHFAGATCNCWLSSGRNKKNAFIVEVGLGYMGYRNKGMLMTRKIDVINNTYGWIFATGYDFGISKRLALGVQFSLIGAPVEKIKYSSDVVETKDLKDDKGSLGYLNLSLGLRFRGYK